MKGRECGHTLEPRATKFRSETLWTMGLYKLDFSGCQLSMYQVRKVGLRGKHAASGISIKKGKFL